MKAFAVIGPSQSGKSTLVDALAGLEGARPEALQTLGDARVVSFGFMDERWSALDLPGGQDSLAQHGPVLAACDAAVLCVPPEADAAVLAAPYLRLLEESGIPTFLFINRIDAAGNRIADIVAALQNYCAHGIVLRQVPMRSGDQITGAIDLISERAWKYEEGQRSSLVELPDNMLPREQEARSELLESLADFDDALLEQIIEDQAPMADEVYQVATSVLQHHDLVPALIGSASQGNGILRLMKSLRHEAPDVTATCARSGLESDVLAVGCLANHLKHLGKTVVLRALGGSVAPGDRLGGDTIGALNALDGKSPVAAIAPGEFAVAIKSDHMSLGCYFTADDAEPLPDWAAAHPPALRRLIHPLNERDESKLSSALALLTEIDPGLSVAQDELSGLSELGVQGTQHLRRVVEKLEDGFGIRTENEQVPPVLQETIKRGMEKHYRHRKQSGGAGQFADVLIDIAPRAAGSGFAFDEVVKGGAVPRNYIPSVETGARDALDAGPAGYPVVDIAVTLKDGKAHSVDSSDYAFRTAGQNAVREALAELGTVVLQPIMNVEINVPSVFAGNLVQLVSGMKGRVLGFEGHPAASGWDVFHALIPQIALEELAHALSSATRGTAWAAGTLDHYEETRELATA